ncbi:lysophospholipid acyltransferase family protein [Aquibacillus koreensis]|uniref:Lysophospholipid acyltransferase family protein n=1 Tax=Aquibacillus koreensis TaxID=279446 RepID=A0A9X4AL52_9BACI|nr:lysophospholipid acyltransferase family protein [Aquibacillus koreensis]MCT2536140.1 lysophospholipid acyltransferase family protein [Aquibacillus koreensis]MDC3422065.1 lysophospholipid acyltransferase family protein [Aquibacillus koreensis]
MITAQKNKRFRKLCYMYQHFYLLKRNFYRVFVKGDVDPIESGPTIYIANHSSWWDGLLLFQLTEKYSELDHYILMDEIGLKKYPFFRKLGAFSVQKNNPREIVRTLKYSEELLKSGKSVWVFPQGSIQHQDKRPYEFDSGIGHLISVCNKVTVKMVSLHYTFGDHQKPIASIVIDDGVVYNGSDHNRKDWTEKLARILEKQVDVHRLQVIRDPSFLRNALFLPVMKESKSTSDYFDQFRKGVRKWTPFS